MQLLIHDMTYTNEIFILNSMRIFMKAFHLLLFKGSFISQEHILIFGLILLSMIDSTSDKKICILAIFHLFNNFSNEHNYLIVPMERKTYN